VGGWGGGGVVYKCIIHLEGSWGNLDPLGIAFPLEQGVRNFKIGMISNAIEGQKKIPEA